MLIKRDSGWSDF